MLLSKFKPSKSFFNNAFSRSISLSTYFPANTVFFYGYPTGEHSGFLNHASTRAQELIAARAFACAGPNVSVISFASTASSTLPDRISEELSLPRLSTRQIVALPHFIDVNLEGDARNEAIKGALKNQVKQGSLIMAQPYIDDELSGLYQIPSELTAWLNDKGSMPEFIDDKFLPKRLGEYQDGRVFADMSNGLTLPAVIKVSSSSAGHGVYLCTTDADFKRASKALRQVGTPIIAERYINTEKNYAIHFGIPHNRKLPIDILGVNEQLTTDEGEFVGGIISSTEIPPTLQAAADYLKNSVLPDIRNRGWYGIGGFDVLIDDTGNAYFIDCNFRMTGMSAYHLLIANGAIKTPIVSITGELEGDEEELEEKLYPYTSKDRVGKFMQIIALNRHGNIWQFNAAINFNSPDELRSHANKLLAAGVTSKALSLLV